jgi:hypothetical protein
VKLGCQDFIVLGLEHLRGLYKGKFNLLQEDAMTVSFGTLTYRCKRTYFSGRQYDPAIMQCILETFVFSKLQLIVVYCMLDYDVKLGYGGHLTVMLRSSLDCFTYWSINKVQPVKNYMKFPSDISHALLELYSSPLRQPDGEIHVASLPGHIWASSITVFSCLHRLVQMVIARLSHEIHQQPPGGIRSSVMCLQDLQPTPHLLFSLGSWRQAKGKLEHNIWYLPGYSTIQNIQYAQLAINSKIIYKNLLLPYDPGGLVIWLDKIGGIPDSRLFIIGLRASRISREEECHTLIMGCHRMPCNLGLGYEMGRGPTLCGFCRSNISTKLVTGRGHLVK